MMKHLFTLIALTALAIAPVHALTPQQAQQAIDNMANDAQLRHASLGVAVYDLDSARVIASHGLDQSDITASTMKTVTSAAALELLGNDFCFETPVYLDGEIKGDRFKGNLVVRGTGDPTLGSRYLAQLPDFVGEIVTALRQRGISRIEGAIVADDSYYPFPYYHSAWDVGDLGWSYGAAVHALNWADNVVNLSFSVDSSLQVSPFTITPAVPGLQVINRLHLGYRDAVEPNLEYATPAIVLVGEAVAKDYRFNVVNPTPAALLADSITHALQHSGFKFKLKDNAYRKLRNPQRTLLLVHRSPALTDIITSLLDRSDNMYAHALLRAIGAHDRSLVGKDMMHTDLDATGIAAIKRWLTAGGVDTSPLFMRDGSGLARANKASPHFFVEMLAMMQRTRPSGTRLCDLMPTAAGRVGSELKATPLATDIVLKSGSMSDVQCFVGYYPARQPRYAWAVLANNYNCSRTQIKQHIGNLLINLFGQ